MLVSRSTAALVADRLDEGLELVDLGEHPLRGLSRSEPVYALVGPGVRERDRPTVATPATPSLLDRRGVTRKEREVLAALAERLSNPEIAERLYVSRRTVESHVSSLLRKLDATNRRDLAARAHGPAERRSRRTSPTHTGAAGAARPPRGPRQLRRTRDRTSPAPSLWSRTRLTGTP